MAVDAFHYDLKIVQLKVILVARDSHCEGRPSVTGDTAADTYTSVRRSYGHYGFSSTCPVEPS